MLPGCPSIRHLALFCIAATTANLTLQSRRELLLAQLTAFRTICSRMADKGKVVTASLKTHFSNNMLAAAGLHMCPSDMDASNTTACMPYGEVSSYTAIYYIVR